MPTITIYIFHWVDGRVSVGSGKSPGEAFRNLGYGGGAIGALDWWEEKKI